MGNYPYRPEITFDAISEAWGFFTQQMGAWIVAELIVFAIVGAMYFGMFTIVLAPMMMSSRGSSGAPGGAALGAMNVGMMFGMLVIVVVLFTLMGGMYRMAIKQVRGEAIAIGDLFSVTDVIGNLALAAILMGIINWIGSLLCIIPGLVAQGLMMFTIPLVVDQRLSAVEALSKSFETLKPHAVMATVFALVVGLVAGLGGILCGVGALFTFPLFPLSVAILYRNFFGAASQAAYGAYPPAGNYPSSPTGPPSVMQ
jgi:uncharacterized membrane protein